MIPCKKMRDSGYTYIYKFLIINVIMIKTDHDKKL